MKNSEINQKLKDIRLTAVAHRLNMAVMDAKEFQKRMNLIISDLDELIVHFDKKDNE